MLDDFLAYIDGYLQEMWKNTSLPREMRKHPLVPAVEEAQYYRDLIIESWSEAAGSEPSWGPRLALLLQANDSRLVKEHSAESKNQAAKREEGRLEEVPKELPASTSPQNTVSSLWEGAPMLLTRDEVIEVIEHQEPAAEIDASEAAEVATLRNGSFVLHGSASPLVHDLDSGSCLDEGLFLCKLNRITKLLRQAFCEGISLKQCRETLEADGHNWQLPGGALVFVQSWQFRSAMRALASIELHPDHIVVSSSIEHLVEETIELAARGSGLWVKARRQLQAKDTDSVVAVASEPDTNEVIQLVSSRTFLSFVPKLRAAAEVTQSTTEADSHKGLNPRRGISYV